MYKLLIILLSFLYPSVLFAQSNANITILFPDIADGIKTDVYQPINGYANAINITGTFEAANGKVQIELKKVQPGVVRFECPLFKNKVFVEPGDQITINIDKDGKYSFSGNNAAGQYFLMKTKPTGKDVENDFESMILPAQSSMALWDSTLLCMKKYKSIYNKLKSDGKITSTLHQYFISNVDAFILMYTYMRFNSHLKSDGSGKRLNTTLSDEAIRSYLEKLYDTYDPYSSRYNSSILWSIIVGNKLRIKEFKNPNAKAKSNAKKWEKFEQSEHVFAAAPDSIQEIEMAKDVLFLIGYGSAKKNEIDNALQIFQQYYPQSKWNTILDQLFEKVPNVVSKLDRSDKNHYYINYDEFHGGIQMMMKKDLSDVHTLQDLVKSLSPGKPLLIDCWATWCSPCITELRQSKELHRFLDSAKINLLYLCFDTPTNRKILQTIQKYNLNGLHYVATDEISQSLIQLYKSETLEIPKFLLFDDHGSLLNANMKLPSIGNPFYDQIKDELKK